MRRQDDAPTPALHVVQSDVRTGAAPSKHENSPALVEAMAAHARACDDLDAALGEVEVAKAKLREARDSAPVSARLSAARAAVSAARVEAEQGAQGRADAERAAADAEGVLAVAEAELDDLESGVRESVRPAQFVRARETVAKAQRLVQHTANVVVACQEAVAGAESRLAVAEEHLAQSEGDTVEHSSVLAARNGLAARERALASARQREREAVGAVEAARSLEGGDAAAQEAPVFASLDAFVEGYVLTNWRHTVDERDSQWCAMWWCHAEAVTVFEAMWEAFEAMRRQPAPSLSTFLRDHFVPHMRNLTAEGGAFTKCHSKRGEEHHEQLPIWQHVYAPARAFPVNPDSQVQPDRDRTDEQGEIA